MHSLIVLSRRSDRELLGKLDGVEVITAREYLTDPAYADRKNVRVFNLCSSYRYQSRGYYVSLLAEARRHRVIPSVLTIQDLKERSIARVISDELDSIVEKAFSKVGLDEIVFNIYFGESLDKDFARLARELYALFPAPALRCRFVRERGGRVAGAARPWKLHGVRALPFSSTEITAEDRMAIPEIASRYFGRKRHVPASRSDRFAYDLAILVSPDEQAPPSDKKAIQRFVSAAQQQGFSVELIDRSDYGRVAEFDALFIRETTAVNHHTYRFARKASADGLIVIDDPDSILKCTNKVYLAELLSRAEIATPKTMIVHSDNRSLVEETLGLPCVLKLPDSSFSQGVVRVNDNAALDLELDRMLQASELIIAQEYAPTEFDWRIGLIDGVPLYACRYYMARGHWQIYNWNSKGSGIEGNADSLELEAVPAYILQAATKSAGLIGDGLYGVDIKEYDGRPVVIEVNDNPSIDAGIEDRILGDELYRTIMRSLRQRLERRRGGDAQGTNA